MSIRNSVFSDDDFYYQLKKENIQYSWDGAVADPSNHLESLNSIVPKFLDGPSVSQLAALNSSSNQAVSSSSASNQFVLPTSSSNQAVSSSSASNQFVLPTSSSNKAVSSKRVSKINKPKLYSLASRRVADMRVIFDRDIKGRSLGNNIPVAVNMICNLRFSYTENNIMNSHYDLSFYAEKLNGKKNIVSKKKIEESNDIIAIRALNSIRDLADEDLENFNHEMRDKSMASKHRNSNV